MKKIVSLILVFGMFFNNCIFIKADNTQLYSYTIDVSDFDEYAIEHVGAFMYGHHGSINEMYELGKGIYVFGETNYDTVLYPIWNGNTIVATFKVILINNQYIGTYSQGECAQLNYVKELASNDNPLMLVFVEDCFYYQVGNSFYYSDKNIGLKVSEEIELISYENGYVENARDVLEYNKPIIPRIPTSYTLGWTYSEHNENSTSYCHAYSLSGLLTNQGYSGYDFISVRDGFVLYEGATVPLVKANVAKVESYLTLKGFDYTSKTSGYLSFESIMNCIYYNQCYVMTGLTHSNGGNHFGVIIAYTNISGIKTYQIYDPQSGGNGICTMDATTRQFTNSDLDTYTFDAGYITNIKK